MELLCRFFLPYSKVNADFVQDSLRNGDWTGTKIRSTTRRNKLEGGGGCRKEWIKNIGLRKEKYWTRTKKWCKKDRGIIGDLLKGGSEYKQKGRNYRKKSQ